MSVHKVQLPEGMPRGMRQLRRNRAGYPVPFFVEYVDGEPDFRIMNSRNLKRAILEGLCWLCGEPLRRDGATRRPAGTFVAGPMCLINKNSAEPPCHEDCAAWSARACPFLTNPNKERRAAGLPESWHEAPGVAIMRNPGVTALIRCTSWKPYPIDGSVLFRMGRVTEVQWVCEGREATLPEVFASVESGLPSLMTVAAEEGPEAQRALAVMVVGALAWMGDPVPGLCPNITQVIDDGWAA